MAKKDIEVNTDMLRSVHERSSSELENILSTQVSVLAPEIEGLSAVWEGPNHDDFTRIASSGLKDLNDFAKSIGAFLQVWKNAYQVYEDAENSVSQHIN